MIKIYVYQQKDQELDLKKEIKMKKKKKNSIRYKTEIILLEEKGYNIIGISNYICGCALDLSLTALSNYEHQERIKGLVMAT